MSVPNSSTCLPSAKDAASSSPATSSSVNPLARASLPTRSDFAGAGTGARSGTAASASSSSSSSSSSGAATASSASSFGLSTASAAALTSANHPGQRKAIDNPEHRPRRKKREEQLRQLMEHINKNSGTMNCSQVAYRLDTELRRLHIKAEAATPDTNPVPVEVPTIFVRFQHDQSTQTILQVSTDNPDLITRCDTTTRQRTLIDLASGKEGNEKLILEITSSSGSRKVWNSGQCVSNTLLFDRLHKLPRRSDGTTQGFLLLEGLDGKTAHIVNYFVENFDKSHDLVYFLDAQLPTPCLASNPGSLSYNHYFNKFKKEVLFIPTVDDQELVQQVAHNRICYSNIYGYIEAIGREDIDLINDLVKKVDPNLLRYVFGQRDNSLVTGTGFGCAVRHGKLHAVKKIYMLDAYLNDVTEPSKGVLHLTGTAVRPVDDAIVLGHLAIFEFILQQEERFDSAANSHAMRQFIQDFVRIVAWVCIRNIKTFLDILIERINRSKNSEFLNEVRLERSNRMMQIIKEYVEKVKQAISSSKDLNLAEIENLYKEFPGFGHVPLRVIVNGTWTLNKMKFLRWCYNNNMHALDFRPGCILNIIVGLVCLYVKEQNINDVNDFFNFFLEKLPNNVDALAEQKTNVEVVQKQIAALKKMIKPEPHLNVNLETAVDFMLAGFRKIPCKLTTIIDELSSLQKALKSIADAPAANAAHARAGTAAARSMNARFGTNNAGTASQSSIQLPPSSSSQPQPDSCLLPLPPPLSPLPPLSLLQPPLPAGAQQFTIPSANGSLPLPVPPAFVPNGTAHANDSASASLPATAKSKRKAQPVSPGASASASASAPNKRQKMVTNDTLGATLEKISKQLESLTEGLKSNNEKIQVMQKRMDEWTKSNVTFAAGRAASTGLSAAASVTETAANTASAAQR